MFAHFQHGGHEPEAVISHHLRHLADRVKSCAKVRPQDNETFCKSNTFDKSMCVK